MIAAIFESVSEAVVGFVGVLGDVLTGVVNLFWDTTASAMTMPGVLLLIGLASGLVFGGIALIRGLISRSGR